MEITPFNFVTHSFIAAKGHNSKAQNCNVHSTLQHYCHSLLTNCLEDFNYLLSCILRTKTFRLSLDFSPHKVTCSLTCRKTKLNPVPAKRPLPGGAQVVWRDVWLLWKNFTGFIRHQRLTQTVEDGVEGSSCRDQTHRNLFPACSRLRLSDSGEVLGFCLHFSFCIGFARLHAWWVGRGLGYVGYKAPAFFSFLPQIHSLLTSSALRNPTYSIICGELCLFVWCNASLVTFFQAEKCWLHDFQHQTIPRSTRPACGLGSLTWIPWWRKSSVSQTFPFTAGTHSKWKVFPARRSSQVDVGGTDFVLSKKLKVEVGMKRRWGNF